MCLPQTTTEVDSPVQPDSVDTPNPILMRSSVEPIPTEETLPVVESPVRPRHEIVRPDESTTSSPCVTGRFVDSDKSSSNGVFPHQSSAESGIRQLGELMFSLFRNWVYSR